MNDQDESESLVGIKVFLYIGIVGCSVVAISSIYALIVICKRKETNRNWYLISIILLSMVYTIGFMYSDILELQQGHVKYLYATISNLCYGVSHWLFQVLLLKTALTLPVIFGIDDKEVSCFRNPERIRCTITTFIVLSTLLSATTLLYYDSSGSTKLFNVINIFQAFTLVLIVFFLKKQINRVQSNLAKIKLIMIHIVNFFLVTCLWVPELFISFASDDVQKVMHKIGYGTTLFGLYL